MGFAVEIVADSVNEFGNRLTTLAATFPRIILAEVNTHRDRTRSAASSRAIPWAKMSERVANDPFVPIKWGMEQSGMQEGQEIPERMRKLAEDIWREGLQHALECAEAIAKIGQVYVDCYPEEAQDGDELVRIHKSIPNRLIEPWMWTTQVMTATEWNNFFRLRCHPDAEVHFQKIAGMMRDARNANTPRQLKTGEWHLPYVLGDELHEDIELLKKVSTARCARVSYLTPDGRRDLTKDVELFDRLVSGSGFGHWAPHEHVAQASTADHRSGPFIGWKQYRKFFANENVPG